MKIVMDTNDLRSLAATARRCSESMGQVGADARRRVHSTQLNTADDSALSRSQPHREADSLRRELDRMADGYRRRAVGFEQRARQIEAAERIRWSPIVSPIFVGTPWLGAVPALPVVGGEWFVPALPSISLGLPVAPRIDFLPVSRAPDFIESGVGLVKRGINWLRNSFVDVSKRIVETAAGAWDRVWNTTNTVLSSVVSGLSTVVSVSVNVVVDTTTSVVTSVGNFVTSAPGAVWRFFGRTWESLHSFFEKFNLIADIIEVANLALESIVVGRIFPVITKAQQLLGKLGSVPAIAGLVLNGVNALVNLYRYGIADARFWESIVVLAGPILASMAVTTFVGAVGAAFAPWAAAGALAFTFGMAIGNLLPEEALWVLLPPVALMFNQYERHLDRQNEEAERKNQEILDRIRRESDDSLGGIGAAMAPVVSAVRAAAEKVIDDANRAAASDYSQHFDNADASRWTDDWDKRWQNEHGIWFDQWNMGYDSNGSTGFGNCTSFVMWRLNQLAHSAGHSGYRADNNTLDFGDGREFDIPRFGNAREWIESARRGGIEASPVPSVGAVAVFPHRTKWGHVAIVREVRGDGTIVIEESAWDAYAYQRTELRPGDAGYPKHYLDLLP